MQEQDKIKLLENDYLNQRLKEMEHKETFHTLSKRRRKRAFILMGAFAFFIIIFSVQIIRAHSNLNEARTSFQTKQQSFSTMKNENRQLNIQVQQLNNKNYVEKVIRDKYYYSKPGETIYSFPDKDSQTPGTEPTDNN